MSMFRRSWRPLTLLTAVASVVLFALAPAALGQSDHDAPLNVEELAPGVTEDDGSIVHSWTLTPVLKNPADGGSGRTHLSYDAAPGTEVKDEVTLYNYSNVQLTFRVYATDAFNAEDGAFDLLPGDKQPSGVGTWVELPQGSITLPARSQATLPITIRVPQAARPGDYAGGILASSRAEGTGPDGKVIGLDRRTGTRLYMRVQGKLSPELAIENLQASVDQGLSPVAGKAKVTYDVVNRGNVRMGGLQTVSISGPFGVAKKSADATRIPELLPGESVELEASFDGVAATGVAMSEVRVEPDPVGADIEAPPVTKRRSFTLAIPYGVIGAAIVALLVRLATRAYRRRQAALEVGPAAP